MNKTPTKQSCRNTKVCVVCAEIPKEVRKVESTKLVFNVRDLLFKYGGIEVESGSICRNCVDKLFRLHKNSTSFYEQCQKNYIQNIVISKRMAPVTPDSKSAKRLDMTKTPKRMQQTKIPTPVSKTIPCLFEASKEISTGSKSPKTKSRTRLDFLKTSPMDNISVGMEVEIGDSAVFATTEITGDPHVTTTQKEQTKGTKKGRSAESGKHNKLSSLTPNTEHGYTKSKREGPRKSKVIDQERNKEPSFVQPDTHDYIKSQIKPNKFSKSYEELRSYMKEYQTNQTIDTNYSDRKSIISACIEGSPVSICKAIMSVKVLKKQIISMCNEELDKQASTMQNRKHNTSVLMQKSQDNLKRFDWFVIIDEFRQAFPDLMIQLMSLMVKPEKSMLYTELEKVIPRLGAIYGILMQGRNKELSLVQRLNSMLLSDNICDQKVFDRLHRQGLCLGYEGSQYMLTITGGKFNDSLIDLVKDKKRFRIIGDNVNWTVDVHDQRVDHRSHMYHAFGSAILVQNIDFTSTPDVYPQRQFLETPCQDFIPSKDDYELYKRDYTVLMSRVVFRHLPYFQRFEDVVPSKLSQPCDNKLATKTKVIPLPVLYKNEQKYQDVVGILDFYEDIIVDACTKAEQNLEDVRIHIGGDQLTRERFSGAKSLRAHEDTPVARFENLSPITFEFFHMHMNFLKMAYSILFKERSAQDNGTLKSLQNRISRSNVGENVASHYDADKDFFISVVDVHIVECFMEFFGMEDVNSAPTKNMPPDFETNYEKKHWYNETVGRLVDQYVLSSSLLGQTRSETVVVDGNIFNVDLPDGRNMEFKVPDKTTPAEKADSVQNYAKRVLELGLLFKDLLDATKLPEHNRHISLLKMSMLLFKSHNNLSKYAFEILRFLVHQICILSERAAKEEFYGLFVNTNGHSDGHIPADRRMEYLVQKVKKHIKHMYSNKTEKNVNLRTSTIAAISDIGERYDDVSNVIIRTQRHTDRSAQGDEVILLESLRMVRPFNTTPGRSHLGFPNFAKSSVDSLDVQHYHEWIRTRKYNFAVEKGN